METNLVQISLSLIYLPYSFYLITIGSLYVAMNIFKTKR